MYLSLAVCENNELQCAEIANAVRRMPIMSAGTVFEYCSAARFREAVTGGMRFDIVLMDIELGGENGIQLVRKLFPPYSHTQIIYITAYINYCTAAYETQHLSFLVKPLRTDALERELAKAIAVLGSIVADYISITSGTSVFHIPFYDIRSIESTGRKLIVRTHDAQYETYGKLAEFSDALDGRFCRCHQSFIINLDHVASLTGASFILRSGESVPISRSRYPQTRDMFLHRIGGGVK